jgi:hypothetical protein
MFASVSLPDARKAVVFIPRSFLSVGSLRSPVISTQSLPPDGSGWIIPPLISDDSA